ncbi:hypothetical protein H1S01_14575 [Heliobacterium chlorum]|uniref:Uncharacterized protein n=1 Tax=Heliobacterium chlorum TaxID=2698 RepID=A0ABR7T4L3_HELCL|nr:hypothetical protein [Heliobacterium chlorum]MBC9785714.1 hypothetical protein [Heliobacterium chlorum]
MTTVLAAIILLGISTYTFNYGRQLWHDGHKPAAVFTYLLALAVLIFPALLAMYKT